jgi:hypothetical protein
MWILKNSQEILGNQKTQNFSQINSIKAYDFSTLNTTITQDKLQSRKLEIIDICLFNKNGKRKCSYQVIIHQKHYFVKCHSDSTHKYPGIEIKEEFLIDNIYVVVGGQVFQQSFEILKFLCVRFVSLC